MILVLLSILVVSSLATPVASFIIYRRARRKYHDASNILLRFFFEQTGEDQNTDFNRALNQTAMVFASQIGSATLTAINTSFGGTMKGAAAELAEMGAQGNLGLVIEEALPKSIKKNKLAMAGFGEVIKQIVVKLAAGNSLPAGGGGGNGHFDVNRLNL